MAHPRLVRLAAQRKATKGRHGLMRKAPSILESRAIEKRYRAMLVAYVEALEAHVSETIIEALPRLVDESNATRGVRADTWVDDLAALNDAATVFGRRRAQRVIQELQDINARAADWNRRQFNKALRSVLGVDIFGGDDGEALRVVAQSWARENAALITDITEKTMTEVEGVAQRAVRTGQSPRDIAKDIKDRFGFADKRAKLIARDQVAKLNGQLTQSRNEALGIQFYTWDTSDDERVRESHRALNGKLCRWDDDTVYSDDGGKTWKSRASIGGYIGHPGNDYQCRCISSPDLSGLLAEIGVDTNGF